MLRIYTRVLDLGPAFQSKSDQTKENQRVYSQPQTADIISSMRHRQLSLALSLPVPPRTRIPVDPGPGTQSRDAYRYPAAGLFPNCINASSHLVARSNLNSTAAIPPPPPPTTKRVVLYHSIHLHSSKPTIARQRTPNPPPAPLLCIIHAPIHAFFIISSMLSRAGGRTGTTANFGRA